MSFSVSILYYSISLRPPLLVALVLVVSILFSISSLPGFFSEYIPGGAL